MAELNSFFEIAIAPRRNAMRARYKDRCQKSTNGVGVVTPLQMAKVPNGVETLPKISVAWVGCTNVTDDRRQTDGRRHEFTFAKKRSIITNRKSTTRFPTSVKWTAYMAPKPPRRLNNAVTVYRIKVDLSGRKLAINFLCVKTARLVAQHSGKTSVFRRQIPCPALDLQLTGDHL